MIDGALLGPAAALGAAMCWVFTALVFAAAGRRVGPTAVNLLRMLLALVMLGVVHRAVFGAWWPTHDATGVWYLALSGVIGLAIGDQCLFTALVDVGPRIATLLMTLAPPVTAIIAWPVLDETLGQLAVTGMTITVIGIGWVILERPTGASPVAHRHRRRGIVLGALAGVCQAVGIVLAKLGMGHGRVDPTLHLDPWPATLVRMTFAAAALALVTGAMSIRGRRQLDASMEASPETEHLPPAPSRPGGPGGVWPAALGFIVVGAVLGPVAGVWLSLVAVDRSEAGIAATLMAMSPVLILPFAVWIEKERITWRAGIGAAVAVVGVAILAFASAAGS